MDFVKAVMPSARKPPSPETIRSCYAPSVFAREGPMTPGHSRFPVFRSELASRYRKAGYWRDVTCDEALFEAAERSPGALALVDRKGELSWRALADAVSRCSGGLRSLGVGPGDVVSWILPNWREAAIVHWSLLQLAAISNPIVPIYRHREVRYILGQAESSAIFAPAVFRGFDYTAMLADLRPELPNLRHVISIDGAGGDLAFEELDGAFDAKATGDRSADDPALLLYTSGTTADPKGAVHTHNTLDFELRSMIEFYTLGSDDVIYMPSPLSHVTGLLYGIQMPALLGASVVYQDQFIPERGLALLERYGCTYTLGATPFLHGLCEAQRARPRTLALHTFVCGGADVPPELIRAAGKTLGCMATRAYGSTEFPTVTGGNRSDSEDRRADTDGRIFEHCQVRVVDEAGNEVAPGVPGELQARGPELFPGYLDGVGLDAFDEEGWFATGDLVSCRDGYLTIEGRIKDIIIRGGENISVKEVEDLLFLHPDVEEAAIVAMPDPAMTERACAFVVPAPNRNPELDTLIEFLLSHRLAKQKLPERLERIDELPKTASGKVQKHKLRTRIRELLAAEAV